VFNDVFAFVIEGLTRIYSIVLEQGLNELFVMKRQEVAGDLKT
jgi:hypothetical protein